MKCRNCGSELREGVKFCNRCGSQVVNIPVVQQPPEVTAPVKGKKKTGVLVGVLVLAILLVCGGGAGYLWSAGWFDRMDTETSQSGETEEMTTVRLLASVRESYGDDEFSIWSFSYDSRGNMTGYCYSGYGQRAAYQYDEKDRLQKEVRYSTYYPPADGVEFEYMYNDAGQYIAKQRNLPDGICEEIWSCEYRSDGQMAVETYKVGDRGLQSYVYEYDQMGHPTGYNIVWDNGVQTKSEVYTCDEDGRVLLCEDLDMEGQCTGWAEYEYDDRGVLLKSTSYWEENGEMTVGNWNSYKFDDSGNLTEYLRYKDDTDELMAACRWSYDSEGNVLSVIECDEDGNVERRKEYTYFDVLVPADSRVANTPMRERIEYSIQKTLVNMVYVQGIDYY